ncbi:hypothetical protein [Neobacillus jeddahensis]|uniref:hypothetical protein n=1 Tax=Neobacillus jeddahensis TaxID=1461580 RepID=UPI00058F6DD4|nr:hypothetical protein [Neobacillus jeddahensis]
MKLSIIVGLALVLLISLLIKREKRNLLENLFIMMIAEFLVTGYIGVFYINLEIWSVADRIDLFIIFRFYEVIIVPFIWFWYVNLLQNVEALGLKVLLSCVFVAIQSGVEQWMGVWKVILYQDWQLWQTVLLQIMMLLILHMGLHWYRSILRKEGIW